MCALLIAADVSRDEKNELLQQLPEATGALTTCRAILNILFVFIFIIRQIVFECM